VRFSLPEAPAVVRIRLFDSEGRLVRTLTDASLTAAGGSALWDGRDQAGRTVRIGVYVVLVEAFFAGRRAQGAYKETVVVARTSRSVAR
jgi:flagellar hook assembly protein FlgD